MSAIVAWLSQVVTYWWTCFNAFVTWAWGVIASSWGAVVDILLEQLPTSVTTYLQAKPWTVLTDYVAPLTWLFPVWTCAAIFFVALFIVSTVWLVRWIIALVPGVSIAGFSIGPFGGG